MNIFPLDPGSPADIGRYASVPIAFEGKSILRIAPLGSGLEGSQRIEEQADPPFQKDYDRMGGDTGPASWVEEIGSDRLSLYLAEEAGRPGGSMLQ